MKLEEYIKRVMQMSTPSINSFHRKPMSRRDLFSQGYLSVGGMVAMPSFLSLVSSRAMGQECPTAAAEGSGMMPVLCVDLRGGANIPGGNVIVGDEGGQLSFLPSGSYSSIGLAPEAEPGNVSLETSLGLAFHPESRMYQGIMSALAPENAAQIDGSVFCARSDDDTDNNPFNPVYWLAKAGLNGKVVSIVGAQDTVSGGRSIAPEDSVNAANRPALIRRPEDNLGLIVPGILADLIGTEGIQKVMQFTQSLSQSQINRFDALSVEEQTKFVLNCVYPNAIDQVTRYNASDIDPTQDEIISQVYDLNNGDDQTAGAIAKLLLDGYAGSGTISTGGNDYHGNPRTTTDQRDLRNGTIIGKYLEAAARKGVSTMVYCYTDGGVACQGTPDAETPGRLNAASDNGQRSSAFCLVYWAEGDGRPPLRADGRRQLGAMQNDGSVNDETNLISNSVPNLTKCFVANYLALHGMEGELDKVFQNPFGQDLEKYLMFAQIKQKP